MKDAVSTKKIRVNTKFGNVKEEDQLIKLISLILFANGSQN